jgi:ATP-binding cassette subfamily F protein 3
LRWNLPGGQKARAALAFLLLARPHLLLLDEPTNHLDLDTIQALVAAIRGYRGAVVVSSHDVRFVQEVVGEAGASGGTGGGSSSSSSSGVAGGSEVGAAGEAQVLVLGGGSVTRWDRGLDAYVVQLLAQVRRQSGVSGRQPG